MKASLTKASKTLLVLGLIAFLLVGFFGLSHSSMAMGEDGNMTMSNCPFMSGQAVVCNMNPLEHIAAWQNMFTSIPQQDVATLLLLLLASLALVFIWTGQKRSSVTDSLQTPQYVRIKEYIPIANSLQELFSNGILNPKLY